MRHANTEALLPGERGNHVLVFAESVRVHQSEGDTAVPLEPQLVQLRADIDHVGLLQYPNDLASGSSDKIRVGVYIDWLRVGIHEESFDGDSLVDLNYSLV